MNKRDIAFIIIIMVVAILSYFIMNISGERDGDMVLITVDGRLYGTSKLHEDREIEMKNEYGYNIISIHDGQVSVTDADCPDKYCVKQGEISKNDESIICLPHKLVIETVRTMDDGGTVDVDSVAK